MNLWTISRITHDWFCRCGQSRSWCACAHANNRRWFIAMADRICHRIEGPDHCKRSAEYYEPPVHLISTDYGVTVTKGDVSVTIPNRLRIVALKEIAKGLE